MSLSRSRLYIVALAGMALFGGLVLVDVVRPGLFPANLALGASLGLAVCGVAVIALRPRRKRVPPHEAAPRDFSAVIEERRKLAEEAAKRPPRLPPE
ncbi:MAG: hypothetical protein Q7J32_00390 [Sphingomonadaceae bacterium]|nr:hypothetical protein [Sphingomonadaceae bacterium]